MKTILTLVGGGDRDAVVLRTALSAASPLAAHLDCLHAHVPAMLAAHHARIEFATAGVLKRVLDRLESEGNIFSQLATDNVRTFCADSGIELCERRPGAACVTASFREEESNELERLADHAKASDLVVMGRMAQRQGLSPYTLETLLRSCGRPFLVAATAPPTALTDTVVVCWKDAASSGAAVDAAAPLLRTARRVVFVSAAKRDRGLSDAMAQAAQRSGATDAELRVIAPQRDLAAALATAADESAADLVVTGAYGRSRASEVVFGSHTDALLERIDRPILLMH